MLELPNFGHMTKFTLEFESRDKICHGQNLWRHNFFKKIFILRRPGVAIFADIKILTTFIKTILKDSRKIRKIRSFVSE